jgi:ABC-type branched-subunit amino acid transport system substrate-binding protein
MKSGNNIRLLAAVGLSVMMSSAMADEPIKIGVPHAMTGAYAGDGESYFRGVEMAVTEINEAGGLLGRPVEMVTFDTQDFAPERMMEAADQLVANEGVVASHAGWAGWGQDVIAFGRYDAPFFMYNASELAIEEIRKNRQQHSNVFQLNDVERPMAEQVVDQMLALPWDYENETVAIVTSDDSWGMEIGAGIRERAEELGWEVVIDETVPYGTREWRPILSRIRNEEPGWIHVEIVYTPDIVTFQRQFSSRPTRSLINYGYAGGSLPDFASEMGRPVKVPWVSPSACPRPWARPMRRMPGSTGSPSVMAIRPLPARLRCTPGSCGGQRPSSRLVIPPTTRQSTSICRPHRTKHSSAPPGASTRTTTL